MKLLAYILVFFITHNVMSQDTTNVKIEAPKIAAKLLIGAQVKVADIEIRFIEVLEDSRCPKDVNCVWAGEAKVVIELYEDNKFLEKKTIIITPTSYLHEKLPIVFSSKDSQISLFNLQPYPNFRTPIKKEDYYLQLIIENQSTIFID